MGKPTAALLLLSLAAFWVVFAFGLMKIIELLGW